MGTNGASWFTHQRAESKGVLKSTTDFVSTNAIGTGTVNLSLNIPTDEREAWGQAAFRSGAKSVGEFMRRMALRGLEAEHPQTADQVRQIRRQYYGTICLITFAAGLIAGEPVARRMREIREMRIEEVSEI
jgi:hypothetical protein